MRPYRDTLPYVGFRPTTPQKCAGWRMLPPGGRVHVGVVGGGSVGDGDEERHEDSTRLYRYAKRQMKLRGGAGRARARLRDRPLPTQDAAEPHSAEPRASGW